MNNSYGAYMERQLNNLRLLPQFQNLSFSKPEVANSIELLWSFKECRNYLQKLLQNTYKHDYGFAPEDISNLLVLLELHDELFEFTKTDPWGESIDYYKGFYND